MNPSSKQILERSAELLAEHGTYKDAAAAIGMRPGHFRSIEKGLIKTPTVEILQKMGFTGGLTKKEIMIAAFDARNRRRGNTCGKSSAEVMATRWTSAEIGNRYA